MRWWHEARFGMFVHWGLYALIGRNEWVHAIEAIPMAEYEKLIKRFKPKPRAAREWAKLAKAAGMKYMVMTTKHHEGFCLWNSRQTDFNAMTACGRDLVQEYVDACREQGLKIGFYYSLMDWHHPDGARSADDPAVRRRFLDFSCCCDGYWLPGGVTNASECAILPLIVLGEVWCRAENGGARASTAGQSMGNWIVRRSAGARRVAGSRRRAGRCISGAASGRAGT